MFERIVRNNLVRFNFRFSDGLASRPKAATDAFEVQLTIDGATVGLALAPGLLPRGGSVALPPTAHRRTALPHQQEDRLDRRAPRASVSTSAHCWVDALPARRRTTPHCGTTTRAMPLTCVTTTSTESGNALPPLPLAGQASPPRPTMHTHATTCNAAFGDLARLCESSLRNMFGRWAPKPPRTDGEASNPGPPDTDVPMPTDASSDDESLPHLCLEDSLLDAEHVANICASDSGDEATA